MKLISQGAEARIYLTNNKIIKYRLRKDYRIKEIDAKLRLFRTKREGKVISKLSAFGFPCPSLIDSNEKDRLVLTYIKGKKVREVMDNNNYKELIREIAKNIAIMHNNHIIHGDLTTSNFILSSNKVYFIDFGLSFFSHKTEDKAVDLHLFREALKSIHYKIEEDGFKLFLDVYKRECNYGIEVVKRLESVERRGRYKERISVKK